MTMFPLRVGKKAARHDPRTLRLATFLRAAALPTPPAELDYSKKVASWGMYANDKIGDCVIAMAAHEIKLWGALEGKKVSPTVKAITSVYRQLSPDDTGCVMLDVLNFWRHTGIAGHKLDAFVALDLGNQDHIKLSVSMFGGVNMGLLLPMSAQAQVGKVWDVPAGGLRGAGKPGSWGGHGVPVVGYNAIGPKVITWAKPQQLTWAFWNAYADEAYALLTGDWQTAPKSSGIDFAALRAALSQIGKAVA